jgi:hypothetical protein
MPSRNKPRPPTKRQMNWTATDIERAIRAVLVWEGRDANS